MILTGNRTRKNKDAVIETPNIMTEGDSRNEMVPKDYLEILGSSVPLNASS